CEVWRQSVDLQGDLFDLGREYVHAAQDDHVIGTPGNAVHTTVARPSGTRFQTGYVVSAEADDRQCFSGERGENQYAFFPVTQYLAVEWITDVRANGAFRNMPRVVGFYSFASYSRTHQLGQPVNITSLKVVEVFDFLTHAFGPGFGTKDCEFQ